MSDPQSNPLLSDPSIIMSSKASRPATDTANDIDTLAPANALSQLLDSAISNAAKETSPEFDVRTSNSNSPPRKEPKYDFKATKADYDRIYTIEELLSLKYTAVNDILLKLPVKDFWGQYKRQPKDHPNNTNNKSKRHNRESRKKKAELHHEDPAEGEPEWGTSEIDADLKLQMGDTVESFERWKQSQREKNAPVIAPQDQNTGNDVDSFFSFVKPSNEKKSESKDTSAKSSRFSSFFTEPPKEPVEPQEGVSSRFFTSESSGTVPKPQSRPPGLTNAPPGLGVPPGLEAKQHVQPGQQPRQPSGPQHPQQRQPSGPQPGQQPGPQFAHNAQQPRQQQPHQPHPQQPHQQPHHQPPPGLGQHILPPGMQHPMPPGLFGQNPNNDSFFRSLISKEGPNGEQPQQLPPWLAQQQKEQSQNKQQDSQRPPGLPQQPHMFPPPGMFPPGIMPPPGMIPPQFGGDPNFRNNQYMQFPPGIMPPGFPGNPGQNHSK